MKFSQLYKVLTILMKVTLVNFNVITEISEDSDELKNMNHENC